MVAILTPTMYVLIVPSGLLLCSMHPIKVLPLEVFRNYYKGHMDKNKGEGGVRGGRWGWLGWEGSSGG